MILKWIFKKYQAQLLQHLIDEVGANMTSIDFASENELEAIGWDVKQDELMSGLLVGLHYYLSLCVDQE